MQAVRQARSLLFRPKLSSFQQTRSRWEYKIKPEIYPCLRERLQELDVTKDDPERYKDVDISLPPPPRVQRNEATRRQAKQLMAARKNADLEKLARSRELRVDLEAIQTEWESSTGPFHIRTLAEHYGIFSHLFGSAFFIPRVALRVSYHFDQDICSPVYRGNTIKPKEATSQPEVEFHSEADDLWTLVLSNPDGNLVDSEAECLHWFVGNIRGGDVSSGEVLCDYLQPFPPRGSGFHRYVFILYKQDAPIDFSAFKKELPCLSLKDRSFSTLDFYRGLQDQITPAGLAWFQADWDTTLTNFFHQTLKMREPVYEYDFPELYMAPTKYFPKARQFNTYMDLHRDPKEIKKELLLQRLRGLDPLEPEPPVLPFPAAQDLDRDTVSWRKIDIKRQRLGAGKYSELYRGFNRPKFL